MCTSTRARVLGTGLSGYALQCLRGCERVCVCLLGVRLCTRCVPRDQGNLRPVLFLLSQQAFPRHSPRTRLQAGCWGCGDAASLGVGIRSSTSKQRTHTHTRVPLASRRHAYTHTHTHTHEFHQQAEDTRTHTHTRVSPTSRGDTHTQEFHQQAEETHTHTQRSFTSKQRTHTHIHAVCKVTGDQGQSRLDPKAAPAWLLL